MEDNEEPLGTPLTDIGKKLKKKTISKPKKKNISNSVNILHIFKYMCVYRDIFLFLNSSIWTYRRKVMIKMTMRQMNQKTRRRRRSNNSSSKRSNRRRSRKQKSRRKIVARRSQRWRSGLKTFQA